jgi:hypothetical protein
MRKPVPAQKVVGEDAPRTSARPGWGVAPAR